MRELEKQLEPWIRAGRSDLDTAALLINEARLTEGLFFCLLAVEKALIAHAVRLTGQTPAKASNVLELLNLTHIRVGEKDSQLLEILLDCEAALHYPVEDDDITTVNQAFDYLDRTRELLLWLERTL